MYDHIYTWSNNDKRATMKGRLCRIIVKARRLNSCLVEFENGQREVVSQYAVRKI